jgi:predicted amidohydrolase YtcJ
MAVDGGGPSSMWYLKPGIPLHTREEFNEMFGFFHRKGQQVSIHAVGDEAVDWVLDTVERAQAEGSRPDHRHRIEHALSPLSASMGRMRDLGIVVCTHPQWLYGWGDKWSGLKRLETRGRGVIPLASYVRIGIPVAMGADPPAFPIHKPQVALCAAATRTTRKGYVFDSCESISVKQALRIQTMGGAFAGFQEREIGSIEKGKLADMVVWDRDLPASKADKIEEAKPLLTLLGGKVVHGGNTGWTLRKDRMRIA